MNLADRLTLFRIILAPVFFAVYFLPLPLPTVWMVVLLWVISIVAELTDMFDGMAARRLNQSSDFGKLFDPFADTLMQLTAFLCFVIQGILPPALFLLIIYREFGILLVRNLMLLKGATMGARISGKIKTVAYIIAGAVTLLYVSFLRLGIAESLHAMLHITAIAVFSASVLISVTSFIDYINVYRKQQICR